MIIAFSHANNVDIAQVEDDFGMKMREYVEKTRQPFYFLNYNGEDVITIKSAELRKRIRFYPDNKMADVNYYPGPNENVITSVVDSLETAVLGRPIENLYFA